MATVTENDELLDEELEQRPSNGLITRPTQQTLSPSTIAEQQRSIAEVQAALTVAKSFPRDEMQSLERIKISCQRVRVAEESAYLYNRGGTEVTGPSIKLMEVIAQHWGNVEFGFKELARYPAKGMTPGESAIQAFAWDLQSNTKRKVDFTVQHAMMANKKLKILTDPRDVYEYVANNAQRRVRTCLENIIPRDIIDEALEECSTTLKVKRPVNEESIAKCLNAFAAHGVTKEMIEARLQRRLDTMTPAQYASLVKIDKSLRDGMSEPADWFKQSEGSKVRKSPVSTTKPDEAQNESNATQEPKPETTPPGETKFVPSESFWVDFQALLDSCSLQSDCKTALAGVEPKLTEPAHREKAKSMTEIRIAAIKGSRGSGSNKQGDLLNQ